MQVRYVFTLFFEQADNPYSISITISSRTYPLYVKQDPVVSIEISSIWFVIDWARCNWWNNGGSQTRWYYFKESAPYFVWSAPCWWIPCLSRVITEISCEGRYSKHASARGRSLITSPFRRLICATVCCLIFIALHCMDRWLQLSMFHVRSAHCTMQLWTSW